MTLEVESGFEAEYLERVEPVFDAMRHEPTFINATLSRDPDDSAKFLIRETWADKGDLLEVQMKRDYRKAFVDRLGEIPPLRLTWSSGSLCATILRSSPPQPTPRVAPGSCCHEASPGSSSPGKAWTLSSAPAT